MIVALVAMLVATKLLGAIAKRLGQPPVLGELLAGVLLGASAFGVVDPSDPFIATFAELGVVILLFTIGLETEFASLVRVGSEATTVAIAGVIVPSVTGYIAATSLGLSHVSALVCGTALCATSVGISARVLSDLGWLEKPEGKIVLAAAVIDDVIGLMILAVVASMVSGNPIGIDSLRSGSGMIVGAFVAGLLLYRLPQRAPITRGTKLLGAVFVPIFFASVGAAVDLEALAAPRSLALGGALIICGIAGKVAAGYAPVWFRGHKLLVGVAMIPRGEVGLIFAQMGLAAGAISAGEYGALMLMVLVTTFVTPLALALLSPRTKPASQ